MAAIAAVYKSWRHGSEKLLYLSVTLFIASIAIWSFSQGWEFGVVYAVCIPALLVWLFIAKHQKVLPPPTTRPQPKQVRMSANLALQHVGHALVVLVGLLITSLLVSLAVSLRLPFADAGQLAVVIVLLPLLWGMLVYHYLATASKVKAVAFYTVLSAASLLLLIYLPGLN